MHCGAPRPRARLAVHEVARVVLVGEARHEGRRQRAGSQHVPVEAGEPGVLEHSLAAGALHRQPAATSATRRSNGAAGADRVG